MLITVVVKTTVVQSRVSEPQQGGEGTHRGRGKLVWLGSLTGRGHPCSGVIQRSLVEPGGGGHPSRGCLVWEVRTSVYEGHYAYGWPGVGFSLGRVKTSVLSDKDPTLGTSFKFNYIFKGPISKYSHTEGGGFPCEF